MEHNVFLRFTYIEARVSISYVLAFNVFFLTNIPRSFSGFPFWLLMAFDSQTPPPLTAYLSLSFP